jgi:hypothetical protein
MNPDQLSEIIAARPFRPLEVATANGDHYVLRDDRDMLFNPRRRPDLFVLFTEDGVMHLLDTERIVSVTIL